MNRESHRHVANRPPKPLLLWDGDCHFCRRWVERWRESTGDEVEYATSQEAGSQYPEIPSVEFQKAVQLVDTDGKVSSGAEAVFRSLARARRGKWMMWSYDRLPGFAAFTELAYAVVAKNRYLASVATRLMWGEDVRRPTYFTARRLFLRSLGFIHLIAFVSLWTQVDGLIGQNGISPVGEYLSFARAQVGAQAPLLLPSLCWVDSSDTFLHFLCGVGAASSVLLLAGFLPAISLLILYVCYLSLTVAGQTFLSFQWDILLLETGFLAIFFAPWKWRLRRNDAAPLARLGLFLLKLLLFKLMFMSGLVKLTSGDDSWWNLTALHYHLETQPLPTPLGWWMQQSADGFKRFATGFVLFVEVLAPFLIWGPRRLRLIGCALLVTLQGLIALTGNYAFFNLLTIALCLLLIDDASWSRALRRSKRNGVRTASLSPGVQHCCAVAALVLLLPINGWLIFSAFKPKASPPRALAAFYSSLEPFRIVNGYGLFRVMTRTRPEIIVEGSADGIDWVPYTFRWKPGEEKDPPRWVAPHQPRLDWQMWFAALGGARENIWFYGLAASLLRNSSSVVQLLERNPFPERPPRYIRAVLYDYRFSTRRERRETGNWWMREQKREYLRPVSLN